MAQQSRKQHCITRAMGDQHGLSHAPCAVDAVKWSEDNLIAVVAGRAVVIASPADITGPRGYAVLASSSGGGSAGLLGCKPDRPDDSVALGLACMVETAPTSQAAASVRALAWSPSGCTQSGACLLTMVSSEGQVQLMQPPSGPLLSRWELAVDLTEQLRQYMEDTNWQDAELAEPYGDGAAGVLRLRGGGSGSKPRTPAKQQQQRKQAGGEAAAGAAPAVVAESADEEGAPSPPAKRQKKAAATPKQRQQEQLEEQEQADKLQQQQQQQQQGQDQPMDAEPLPEAAAVGPSAGAAAASTCGEGGGSQAGRSHKKQAKPPAAAAAGGGDAHEAAAAAGDEPAEAAAAASEPAPGEKRKRGRPPKAAAAATPGAPKSRSKQRAGSTKKAAAAAAAGAAADGAAADGDAAAAAAAGGMQGRHKRSAASKKAAGGSSSKAAGASDSKEQEAAAAVAAAAAGGAAAGAAGAGVGDPNAHLPRTAMGHAAFAVGAEVEVMMSEEGLAGAWFSARVVELQHGFALVEFDALYEEESSDTRLREWFPLPGPGPAADPAAAAVAARGYYFHTDPSNVLRPQPPQQLLALPGKPAPGDSLEAFVDDGWWCTRVLSATAAGISVPIGNALNVVSVPLQPNFVRNLTMWEADTGIWDHAVLLEPGAPPPASGAEPGAGARSSPKQSKRKAKADKPPSGSSKKKPAAATATAAAGAGAEAAAGDDAAAAAAGRGQGGRSGRGRGGGRRSSGARTPGKSWVDDTVSDVPGLSSSDGDDADVGDSEGGTGAAAARRRGDGRGRGRRTRRGRAGSRTGRRRRGGGSGSDSGSDWAADGPSDADDESDHEISDEVGEEEESEPEEVTDSEDLEGGARGCKWPTSNESMQRKSLPTGMRVTTPAGQQPGSSSQVRKGKKGIGPMPAYSMAVAAAAAQRQAGTGLAAAAAAAAAAAGGGTDADADAGGAAAAEVEPTAAAAAAAAAAAMEEDEDTAAATGPLAACGKRSVQKKTKQWQQQQQGAEQGELTEDERSATEDEEGDPEAEYEVPADFDAATFTSMLPQGCSLSDAGAKTWNTLVPRLIAQRFAALRVALDRRKLPRYSKGQHLRKADLRLWTQVWAEFNHLHKAQMEAVTEAKKLITATKAIIRKAIIQSFDARVRDDTAAPYLTKGYINLMAAGGAAPPLLDGSEEPATAGVGSVARRQQRLWSLKKAMLAAAQGQVVPGEGAGAGVGRGQRKRSEPGEGLGLIAAAAVAAVDGQQGSIVGPLSMFAESQDAAVGCKSFAVKLSQQAAGLEMQLASNSLRGPSLRVHAGNVISARSCGYVPAYAYDNSNLATLQGPKISAAAWEARRTFMAATAAAWSNTCVVRCDSSDGSTCRDSSSSDVENQQCGQQQQQQQGMAERVALLAVGSKAGCVQLWRYSLPQQYSSSLGGSAGSAEQQQGVQLEYLGAARVANGAYVTSLTWAVLPAAAAAAAAAAGVACVEEGAAQGAAAAGSSSSCAVLPGCVCRRQAGDVLLLAVGTSSGDVTLWSADPTAAAANCAPRQTLASLGTAMLPDRQPALVLDMAVVAAAAGPVAAAAAAADPGPSDSCSISNASAGWQLLLAAGKNLGSIAVWRSGVLVSNTVSNNVAKSPAAAPEVYGQQQLSLAVSTGESTSRRCHGVGFVTGVLWSPMEQQLSSCGADGQLLSWVWTKEGLQPGRPCSRFNRQWLRPRVASVMTHAARAVAPMSGLAGSGGRLVMATARDWRVTEAAGEMDAIAGAGVRINACAWEKVIHGALQLYSSWGPSPGAAAGLQQLLTGRMLPSLLWQGCQQPVLPAGALWDVAVAVARCGWQSLSPLPELLDAQGGAGEAAGAAAGAAAAAAAPGSAGLAAGTCAAADAAGQPAAEQHQGAKKNRGRRSEAAAGEAAETGAVDVNLAGIVPVPVGLRTEMVQKMAKKQLLEVQLQLELLTQLLHALTAPFEAAVAAPAAAGDGSSGAAASGTATAALSYRPGVPVAAWRGVQLACYLSRCFVKLWQGPQQRAVQQLPQAAQLLGQLQQLLQRWELELLQRHVYCSLNGGLAYCLNPRSAAALAALQRRLLERAQQQQQLQLPVPRLGPNSVLGSEGTAATVGAAAAVGFGLGRYPVSEVLMADWVSLNICSPDLNGDELLRPAAVVYAGFNLPAPLALEGGGSSGMPARESNPLDADQLPAVHVSGQEAEAMETASVVAEMAAAGEAAAVGAAANAAAGGGDAVGVDVAMAVADGSAAAAAGDGSSAVGDSSAAVAAPVVVSWPRCAASLMLCSASSSMRSSWGCSCCGRRYMVPPSRGIVAAPAAAAAAAGALEVQACVPYCLVCSCRLFPGGAGATGLPGATAGVRQVLDGSPVLGVGISLTDVMLPGV